VTPTQLKEARRKLGLSSSQMARALGIGPEAVRRLEMTSGKPTSRAVTPTTQRLIQAYLDGYRPSDWPARN
jgi:DNA-binding transcriptional regulator YiaG